MPKRFAAAPVSFIANAAPEFVGFHSTATREIRGITSLNSSTRFPATSWLSVVKPVRFPPGVRQTGNETGFNRIEGGGKDDRNRLRRSPDGLDRLRIRRNDDGYLQSDQLGCESGKAFDSPFGISVLDMNVLAFYVAQLTQALSESVEVGRCRGRRPQR